MIRTVSTKVVPISRFHLNAAYIASETSLGTAFSKSCPTIWAKASIHTLKTRLAIVCYKAYPRIII